MFRLLKRTVIIRQYDYEKTVRSQGIKLYDRVSWRPLTVKELEHKLLIERLRGREKFLLKHFKRDNPIVDLLELIMQDFYNPNYLDWTYTVCEDNFIWIQSASNRPVSMLGIGTFEKDFT